MHSIEPKPSREAGYPRRGARLSVTIIAKNEERTIAHVLRAVQPIADEIIFVDSGSIDQTVSIAKSFGVRFYHQDWLGYAAQKNRAIELATGDWILSLDADEVLTPGLVDEIAAILDSPVPDNVSGYKIPRVLFIGNEAVKRGGFYPDAQLRLFRRGRGKFEPRAVHEAVRVEGDVLKLKNDILHYSYSDVEQFAAAMEKYAQLSASHYLRKSGLKWRRHQLNEAVHPLWTFFYRMTVRGGLLGGPLCWKLNLIYADYVRKKIRYLRDISR